MSALEPPPFLDALREEFARVADADAQAAATAPARRLPRLRLPQLRMAQLAVVLLLLVIAGSGVAASGLLSPSHDGDRGGEVALRPNERYAPALRQTLALLQRAPEPVQDLPPELVARGIVEGAIRLSPPAPAADVGAPLREPAWVVPARDESDRLALAMVGERGFGMTPGLAEREIRSGRTYLKAETSDGSAVALVGLAPDGVDRVTVEVGGRSVELPVRDNTFGAVLRAPVGTDISWSGRDGP